MCKCGQVAFVEIEGEWLCANCIKATAKADNFDFNNFFNDIITGGKND